MVGGRPPILVSTIADTDDLAALVTDDWNSVHISARGNMLVHMLNHRLASIVIDDDAPNRPVDGLIGVQVHVGPPMKVEYQHPLEELVRRSAASAVLHKRAVPSRLPARQR